MKPKTVINDKLEMRAFACEFRSATATDGKIKFTGHAAIFDTPQDMGPFTEQIAKNAFTRAIKEDDVRALFNHDANHVLGRNVAATLRMSEDDKGLAVEIDAPDTQMARDLKISVDRGDINQMSFAFVPSKEEWAWDTEPVKRTIVEVRLYDVSIVTYAAYPQTDVSARTFDTAKKEKELIEAEKKAKDTETNKNHLELLKRQAEIKAKEI